MKRLLWGILLASLGNHLCANVGDSMTKFFNKFGIKSNATAPQLMQDQSAGYVTGGGTSFSPSVTDMKLAHVEMPSVRYGSCGDIDIYNGGFSFIKGEEIVRTLKNVASSAMGYAFMLSLETVSPQFANTVKQMQSWANTINGIGINSCEAGASLASAVWPRSQMASQAICRTQGASGGMMSDYISARHGCAESGTYDRTMKAADDKNPDILKDEFNLAWHVIRDDTSFGGSDLKHLFMAISGTVVSRKTDNGKFQTQFFESKVMEGDFMQKLMEGGQVPVYACRDSGHNSKCLDVRESTVHIDTSLAMKERIRTLLRGMQQKIASDTEFSEEEKGLLNKTRIPILRMFNVMMAYRQGPTPLSLDEYSEVVAIDMVCQYLRSILNVIRANISRKMQVQFDSTLMERFEKSLFRVEQRVKEYEGKVKNRMEQLYMLEKKLRMLEQDIYNKLNANVET